MQLGTTAPKPCPTLYTIVVARKTGLNLIGPRAGHATCSWIADREWPSRLQVLARQAFRADDATLGTRSIATPLGVGTPLDSYPPKHQCVPRGQHPRRRHPTPGPPRSGRSAPSTGGSSPVAARLRSEG